jgi:hypothetical protein
MQAHLYACEQAGAGAVAKTRTSWQQGFSGNPSGRPKVCAEIRDQARQFGPQGILKLAQMAGLLTDEPPAEAEAVRLGALKELLDRGYGKATTVIAGNESETPLRIDFQWAPASEPETTSTQVAETATAALTSGEAETPSWQCSGTL